MLARVFCDYNLAFLLGPTLPKWHLGLIIRFRTIHAYVQQTDRQTDGQTVSRNKRVPTAGITEQFNISDVHCVKTADSIETSILGWWSIGWV